MTTTKVYADFQNLDDLNRLRLTCWGTRLDLERQRIELHEGRRLTFVTDDADDEGRPTELLATGVVQYDADGGYWTARVDWAALRHNWLSSKLKRKLRGRLHRPAQGSRFFRERAVRAIFAMSLGFPASEVERYLQKYRRSRTNFESYCVSEILRGLRNKVAAAVIARTFLNLTKMEMSGSPAG